MLEKFRLDGQVAIVTGAGKGIGAAIAAAYAEAGADVVLTARTEADLEAVAAAVRAQGRTAVVAPGDVNDLDFLAALVDRTVAELGRIDLVVNNAGGSMAKPTLDTEPRALESSFHFNVTAPLELVRRAVPHMLERDGGAVVNIGSVAGINANRGSLSHSVTKAALAQMTRVMASDLAPRVRVNAVLPGAVDTPMLHAGLARGHLNGDGVTKLLRGLGKKHVMGRVGQPKEIGQTILFLTDNDRSSFMTGQALIVDGGATARLSTE